MAVKQASEPVQRFPMDKERLLQLNLLSVEPQLLATAAQLLYGGAPAAGGGALADMTHELRLAQSALVSEYGGAEETASDNHAAAAPTASATGTAVTSLVPPPPASPDAIEVVL